MIRQTSREAYQSVIPTLNGRQKAVLELLEASQKPLTNKEIADKLGWKINTVTPRTGELVLMGYAYDAGFKRDDETGRKAHTWAAGKKVEKPRMGPEFFIDTDGIRKVRFVPVPAIEETHQAR